MNTDKQYFPGAKEMAPRLRVLVACVEDRAQFPALTWWFATTQNPSSKGSDALFQFPWAPSIHVVTNIHAGKILTHKIHKIIIL